MRTREIILTLSAVAMLSSCVSKKKYTELEKDRDDTKSELMQTRTEKQELENQMNQIEMRVERYNNKIASLQTEKDGMMVSVPNESLVLSEKNKQAMRKTLKDVPASKLAGATSLKDSLNIAISHNISKKLGDSGKDLNLSIEETMVKINIDDNLLFGDSSFSVGRNADDILSRIADVIKSEPSLEVLVEGHTDSRTIKEESYIVDNWDLSARRSAAVVRRLETKFNVPSEQLIVAGRSSYDPVVPNNSKENMAKNRRTQIVIMPNLDKFFAMLDSE
ncbi:OmpA family protein [Psychroflexus sp. CAK8W]|uniref:OmpA family protein n=1 Tax=Psychroflexus longus TaxID=2873596 RepID=A0ABS7XEL3_9FLAO|nr:OmpA family protein [Psychroflexus longus]MBZ9777380.1 OmpA family protein [Psychroflexus longus]